VSRPRKRSAPRVRRDPEQARAHILDAAERVFAVQLPDAVGLREVAAEAEVSHGLVTHYFRTYDGLVNAVLARRTEAARKTAFAVLAQATFVPGSDDAPLLTVLIEILGDPLFVRLLSWALLSGRDLHAVIGAGQMGLMVSGLEARLASAGVTVPREQLEFSVTAAIAIMVGWAIAGPLLARAVGTAPLGPAELKREVQRMMRAYLMQT
jgi:TetR/AcrR family transcriptional regulator, repressor for neighboring sulfatase